MNEFVLWLSFGKLEVRENSGIPAGEAHIHTQQGAHHTIWTPKTPAEVSYACNVIVTLGEEPCGLAMNPTDYEVLKSCVLVGPSGLASKPKICECGSAKVKLPTHSSWCPVNT